jgi:hypothetical protein
MAYLYEGYKWRIHVKKTTAAMTNKDIFHIRALRNWQKLGENLGLILLMSSRFMAVGQIILILIY